MRRKRSCFHPPHAPICVFKNAICSVICFRIFGEDEPMFQRMQSGRLFAPHMDHASVLDQRLQPSSAADGGPGPRLFFRRISCEELGILRSVFPHDNTLSQVRRLRWIDYADHVPCVDQCQRTELPVDHSWLPSLRAFGRSNAVDSDPCE